MAKEIDIPTDNGSISARHHKGEKNKWLFLCHGFGGNKERGNKRRAKFMNKNGWNTVRFDFRGNGDSAGDFIDQNLSSRIKDLKTVIEHFDPDRFFIFGTSFGGKVAIHCSTDLANVEGLFLKCPVTYNNIMSSFKSAVENKGQFEFIDGKPIDKKFFDDLEDYNFENTSKKIDLPVAITHGREDTTVHLEKTLEAAKHLEKDTELYCLEGEKHSFSEEGGEKLRSHMLNWLEKYS